jgi:uncharacterized delta-60 repeat protein
LLVEPLEDRRLLSAGDLDVTFGVGGIVQTDFVGSGDEGIQAIVHQPDGKIVAVGNSTGTVALARYDTDGSLDAGFGSGGVQRTSLGSLSDFVSAVALQSDGKIVVAGRTIRTDVDLALLRYNANGSLDMTFGIAGIAIADLGGDNFASDLVIQPDGRIVVAASKWTDTRALAVARFNTNGTLDSSFGAGGSVVSDFGHFHQQGRKISLDSQGRVVVAMSASATGSSFDYAAVRYLANGTLDTGFGSGGLATVDFGGLYGYLSAMELQSDDRIVLGGFVIRPAVRLRRTTSGWLA